MPRISDEKITEILTKTNLVDIVSEKVALSKQGKSYFGLCPFHHEKTPSFSVEPERQIYNCFSCGEKGNAITFKQKTENLTFVEALEDLAIRANIDLDFEQYKKENPNQGLFGINEDAKNFYKLYLNSTKAGSKAISYLKERGLTDDIIETFELGLSPNEYDILFKTLHSKEYLDSDLFDLGLIKKSKNDNYYDLFRDRIIFPIHDEKGNVVAFSGRTYLENDDNAKYINSPQTKIFTKSTVLYHLDKAINEIKKENRVVLFEGYMDVIAGYRAGILCGVASMGTSLTKEQVKLIKKYTSNVTICYDGDGAGIEAASRAITLFQQEQIDVKVVILPDQLDPDDYIKKYNEESLKDYIDNKWMDSIEFNYRKSNMNIDFNKMLDIEHFKKTIFDMIKNSSNTIIESYIKRLSEDTNISIESIRQDFNQYTKRNISNIRQVYRPSIDKPLDKYEYTERRLLNYFLSDHSYMRRYRNEFGPVFCINNQVLELQYLIEDLYSEVGDTKEPVDMLEKFIENLNEAQLDFFETRCKNDKLQLLQKEYDDMIDVLNEYQDIIQRTILEEKIKEAPTAEEKIRLALYRDIKIKEDKHGQR
jgi:DNA primase